MIEIRCRHPGCDEVLKSGDSAGRGRMGFCNLHYLRLQRGQDMDAPRPEDVVPSVVCKHPGCERSSRRADNGRAGYCALHNRRKKLGHDMDAPLYLGQAVCKHPGCERPHAAKGYCNAHYQRFLSGKPMDAPIRDRRPPKHKRKEFRECSVDGCDREVMAKGMCNLHYYRSKKGVDLNLGYRPKWDPVCRVEGCDKPSQTLGYCTMHYSRHLKGKPMTPGKLHRQASNRLPVGTIRPSGRGGYTRIKVAEPDVWVDQHRHVMEQRLGRPLRGDENVHHINGDRADNRDENLELWSRWQPAGQRVEDKTEWAIEWLREYAPQHLAKEPAPDADTLSCPHRMYHQRTPGHRLGRG